MDGPLPTGPGTRRTARHRGGPRGVLLCDDVGTEGLSTRPEPRSGLNPSVTAETRSIPVGTSNPHSNHQSGFPPVVPDSLQVSAEPRSGSPARGPYDMDSTYLYLGSSLPSPHGRQGESGVGVGRDLYCLHQSRFLLGLCRRVRDPPPSPKPWFFRRS